MIIDLQKLNYTNEITINDDISYSDDFIKNTDIIHLNKVHAEGNIKEDIEFNYVVNLKVVGEMILHDSINYDEIPYEFTVDIEEILENSLKSLDLNEFLWHYIVLEIPLRYTLVSDDQIATKKDDYEVISEEEYKTRDNPFKDFFLE